MYSTNTEILDYFIYLLTFKKFVTIYC